MFHRVSVLKVRGITHDFKDTLTSIPVELAWKGKTVVKSKVAHSYQYTSRLAKCSVEILNPVRPFTKPISKCYLSTGSGSARGPSWQ